MSKPLFSHLSRPQYQLRSPDVLLSEAEFDLLRLTVEDFRFVTRPVTVDFDQVAADVRSRSTILRRLLSERDLFKAGKFLEAKRDLRVCARMLDFEPAHPTVVVSCGNYPWFDDRIPGVGLVFSIKDVEPPASGPTPWTYRHGADVSLGEYLDGLAIAVLGTRIRRRDLVKYVADKKAAHVSDRRKHATEEALDRAWSILNLTIKSADGRAVQLNVAYLELLSVIVTLSESQSIREYIDQLGAWISSATLCFPEGTRRHDLQFPVQPIA